jgi:CcmD family protein
MAETFNYFFAGYSVIFVGLIGYLVSLRLRWQKVQQELALLREE